MGNDSSKSSNADIASDVSDVHGWRILHVYAESPSSNKHIIPYIECITHIDNVPLNSSEQSIIDSVKQNQSARYTLYNIANHSIRDIDIHAQRFATGPGMQFHNDIYTR